MTEILALILRRFGLSLITVCAVIALAACGDVPTDGGQLGLEGQGALPSPSVPVPESSVPGVPALPPLAVVEPGPDPIDIPRSAPPTEPVTVSTTTVPTSNSTTSPEPGPARIDVTGIAAGAPHTDRPLTWEVFVTGTRRACDDVVVDLGPVQPFAFADAGPGRDGISLASDYWRRDVNVSGRVRSDVDCAGGTVPFRISVGYVSLPDANSYVVVFVEGTDLALWL